MEETLLTKAVEQGIWALLFVSLYLYQLQDSRRLQFDAKERENKLTDFLRDITRQFELLAKQYERLSDDVQEIKSEIRGKGQ
ncbi:hypothetical protein GJ688_02520 [Heliobacillus mobilis]|uniref:BhlA holin family protein n=1 Tax=Heliobacterium mobile TaxID=28064 RepID=A0A6I3SBW8_HELMO|nr:BhlA/UviB family holin-like peptide [Heliobacterium mobile]MTV47858.1 hypothetical protein [Heliobacterium mobile]